MQQKILPYIKTKIKYWKIFNYRLKELTDNVDTKNTNLSGASRAMTAIVPLVIITALIEYLWIKVFGGNSNKFT